jgi:hypothetical protein
MHANFFFANSHPAPTYNLRLHRYTVHRYIMKDKLEPHFSLPFTVGGCDRTFLEQCFQDYQVVASYKYNKDGQLLPDSFMKHVTTWVLKHMSPLDIHPIQAVRIMLLEGYWQLSEKWCKPGAITSTSCYRVLL